MNEVRELRDCSCFIFSSAWHNAISSSFPLHGTAISWIILSNMGKPTFKSSWANITSRWSRSSLALHPPLYRLPGNHRPQHDRVAQNCKDLKKFACGSCVFDVKAINAISSVY
ncbi:hypothetical protein ACFX13_018232 [Malus domestica]